jgi:HTH-type transcriptional regulator/antitoxin HipB
MPRKVQAPPDPAAPQLTFLASPAELGHAIEFARRSRGLSQDDVAAKARVSRSFVNQLEQGKDTAQIGKVLTVMMCVGLVGFVTPVEAAQGLMD